MKRRGGDPGPPPRVDARAVALDVLVRVETTAAFADVLLSRTVGLLPPGERGLATDLVYGVLAWQARLDHELRYLLRGTIERLEPAVRVALRLGLYQLRFLDRVPAYAAVDSSVRLVRRAGRGATGLVNAVLRRAARAEPDAGPPLDDAADALDRLAIEWSHPRWLVELLVAQVGLEETPALLAAHNRRGGAALRPNPARSSASALAAELTEAGMAVAPAHWMPDALAIERGAGRVRELPAWRDGRVSYQSEASQLVTRLLGLEPGATLLDACAAPGGKTMQAAGIVGPAGRVLAADVHRGGARRIAGDARRLGVVPVHPFVADMRRPPLTAPCDGVLLDAPCSGLGTLRRHPELRWRRRPEDLPRLAGVQRELLTAVAPLVRPGGVLVYAVCTPARIETDDVVAAFLAGRPDFVRESAAPHLPPTAGALVTREGALRTWPHRHGLDAFFAVRLRRR